MYSQKLSRRLLKATDPGISKETSESLQVKVCIFFLPKIALRKTEFQRLICVSLKDAECLNIERLPC
jgi:hypothetical protein